MLGRSAFRTSVNYRSVVIFGTASEVTDADEKLAALRAIVEAAVPGRWQDVRTPSPQEMQLVLVLRLPLVEVSAKVRTGPPADEERDYARDCWAGVIPLRQTAGPPVDDPRLAPGVSATPLRQRLCAAGRGGGGALALVAGRAGTSGTPNRGSPPAASPPDRA